MTFLCPRCRFPTELPRCRSCGYEIPAEDGVFQMTDEPNINMDTSRGERYIGYDAIGEDFDPLAIYNRHWNTGDGVYRSCTRKLVEVFGKDCTVLDLGAGLGAAALPLSQAGVRVVAADISQTMLRILRGRAGDGPSSLCCCRMNAYRLMLPDRSVDAVVENRMLHLVENPRAVIREIVRVLRPEGALVRYNTRSLPGDPREYEVNNLYFLAIRDVTVRYFRLLRQYGYEEFNFDNRAEEIVREYFREPERLSTGLEWEFKQKMKLRIHRLRTKAHSGLQHVPDSVHQAVWRETERYAARKYGEDFDEIPSYSKYTSTLDVYRLGP